MLSVIIPVYNNWHLTKQCLTSLAKTTPQGSYEVIVIDNASTDATPKACPPFLAALFPGNHQYERMAKNCNFAGAINRGVAKATHDFVFWLNNDTILLDNWLPPLEKAFAANPSLGAIGPLLLYPDSSVQHLGITFSLDRQVAHLYEWFPASHAVVGKERTFQAITGAAFYIPRSRFLALGGLDERFVNGFEDIEFCDRLLGEHFVQAVVPTSRIIHLAKQSEGRSDCDRANSQLCSNLCRHIRCDKPRLWREDGYEVCLSPWFEGKHMILEPLVPKKNHPKHYAEDRLQEAVAEEPFWFEGALALAQQWESQGNLKDAFACYTRLCRFCSTPKVLIPFALFACRHDPLSLSSLIPALQGFQTNPDSRLASLYHTQKQARTLGDVVLAHQAKQLQVHNTAFFEREYPKLTACLEVCKRVFEEQRS
ncbi:MAG: glycosyltransferase family 2 protein [Desulfovibrio sp.]|nr:glycosyltransferase family 2 protein [Desulfovibrio sp.]